VFGRGFLREGVMGLARVPYASVVALRCRDKRRRRDLCADGKVGITGYRSLGLTGIDSSAGVIIRKLHRVDRCNLRP
jgi:hypothetical protein